MSAAVNLTLAESARAGRLAERLASSVDAQKQTAARVTFLAELERLCRLHHKRLPMDIARHLYRVARSTDAAHFQFTATGDEPERAQ